jgi:hypothetical protein
MGRHTSRRIRGGTCSCRRKSVSIPSAEGMQIRIKSRVKGNGLFYVTTIPSK